MLLYVSYVLSNSDLEIIPMGKSIGYYTYTPTHFFGACRLESPSACIVNRVDEIPSATQF